MVIAVDTNVLLNLADDSEPVWDCLATLRERLGSPPFLVLPTVVQELVDIGDHHDSPERELALKTIGQLRIWGFRPVSYVPVDHETLKQLASHLRSEELLPPEEVNDSFILAEAGFLPATMLLTSDSHLLDLNRDRLKIEMDAFDAETPIIVSPRKIVADFFRTR